MEPIFKAKILNGRMTVIRQDEFRSYISTLPEDVEVIVRKQAVKREPRSNQQNRYYWGCVLPLISETTGHTIEECHEICKHFFSIKKIVLEEKRATHHIKIPISTKQLNTVEMEEYLSKVRSWASMELSCYIPLPNEVNY